jgi:hypothetical protein
MRKLSIVGLLALTGLLGSFVWAQETKGIQWKHGLAVKVRKVGQTAWTDDTPKIGAEVFLDKDLNQLVYITEKGALSLAPANKLSGDAEVKRPQWHHALEVKVRPPGVEDFNKAVKVAFEVYKDPNADNLVYVTEVGSIAALPAAGITPPDKIKDPVGYHGLEMKARKHDEKEFSDATAKYSMEVYRDENTNQLIYVTEKGQIATVPATGVSAPEKVKTPVWYHGFSLGVRQGDDKDFTKAKKFGVEVYKDENANMLVYITETGSIAVVPAGTLSKPASSKEPTVQFGRSFQVRKADEPNFTDKTQRFGTEVYKDEITGNSVYISETGQIAVLPK